MMNVTAFGIRFAEIIMFRSLTRQRKTDPSENGGRMHREYLEQHHPIRINDLVLSGRLWTYLADLNEQAQERFSLIIELEGVTEELKAADQNRY